MNSRWLIAAVIVLVLLVGGIFVAIGLLRGDETNLEPQPIQESENDSAPRDRWCAMSTNRRTVDATPEQVWEVLCDGWLYPLWVVGASRMREVDDTWPAVGSQLHHSAGTWPLLIDDTTEVYDVRPGSMLSLRARGWPMGEAHVVLHLNAVGTKTEIVIEEDVVAGPGSIVPKPARDLPLHWRNVETLRRLAYLVERRPR